MLKIKSDEHGIPDKFPEDTICKLKTEFFEMAEKLANNDKRIDTPGDLVAYLSTAALRICSETFCLTASVLDSTPEAMRKIFIAGLNKFEYESTERTLN